MEKLKMDVLNEKNEVVNTFDNQKQIVVKLVELLWSKYINKASYIKRIAYNYNYSDVQKITFYLDNKYKYIISGIPTSWGSIKDYELIQLLNEEDESNE